MHDDLVHSGSGHERDPRRGDHAAGHEQRGARLEIAGHRPNGPAGRDHFVDEAAGRHWAIRVTTAGAGPPVGIEWSRQLHRHDRVGSLGKPGAGGNTDGGLRDHGDGRGSPGSDIANHAQRQRRLLPRLRCVRGPHRIAVHRRVGPWRQRDARRDRLGHNAPQRRRHGGPLRRDRHRVGQDCLEGGLHAEKLGRRRLAHRAFTLAARRPATTASPNAMTMITMPTTIAVSCQNWYGKSCTSRWVVGSKVYEPAEKSSW